MSEHFKCADCGKEITRPFKNGGFGQTRCERCAVNFYYDISLNFDRCAVTTLGGEHCPEKANHYVNKNGVFVRLCDRCYENLQNGAYGGL